jgi:hypothetical protein
LLYTPGLRFGTRTKGAGMLQGYKGCDAFPIRRWRP